MVEREEGNGLNISINQISSRLNVIYTLESLMKWCIRDSIVIFS